jgi:anhydro-N-acetylmuramic acid kinase
VIGLISGTSADGVDAALVDIRGSGLATRIQLRAATTVLYEPRVRARVLELAAGERASAAEFAGLDALLGEVFAGAALAVAREAGVAIGEVDLIGSHGQTIAHAPRARSEYAAPCTWQIGSAAIIAERTGRPIVSDLRSRDVAAGGEGAPLVPLVDYLLLRSKKTARAALNIGGVANVTCLPADCALEDVLAFDTGPGNALLDELATLASGGRAQFDAGGTLARTGRAHDALVLEVLRDPFFERTPPRSTGRDVFGRRTALQLWERGRASGLPEADVMASAVVVTARSIAHSLARWFPRGMVEEVVASGGGVHNGALMEALAEELARLLPRVRLTRTDAYGLPVDAKEAVAFAVLANETVHARAGNVPRATGAARPVILGSITPAGIPLDLLPSITREREHAKE